MYNINNINNRIIIGGNMECFVINLFIILFQVPECKIGNADNICSGNKENLTAIPRILDSLLTIQKTHKTELIFNSTEELTVS